MAEAVCHVTCYPGSRMHATWAHKPPCTHSPCAGAQAGTYSVTLMVTDWLGQTDSTTWSFTKAAAALPLVQLVGGTQQSFTISQGISVPVQIFLQSVCAGTAQNIVCSWQPTGMLHVAEE